jgi:tetratricopeptide (TPR) repeat protein
VETALRISGSLSLIYWYWRGYWNEGRRWLDQALALPGAIDLPQERGRALIASGVLSWLLNDYATSRERINEGMALADASDPWVALGPSALAWVVVSEGDLEEGRRLTEQSLAMARRTGIRWHIGDALHSLGAIIGLQGDYVSGAAYVQEAYSLLSSGGERWGTSYALNTLGDFARLQGDYVRAGEYYAQSLDMFNAVKNRSGAASAFHNLGYVALQGGNIEEACRRFHQAYALFRELGDRRGIAECVIGFGTVAVVEGQLERAARLFGAGERAFRELGTELSRSNARDHEHYLALLQSRMGEQAFQAAREEGRSMMQEEAVSYALEAVPTA